jgi:hypothetical protein
MVHLYIYTFEEDRQISSFTNRVYKFYVILGIFLVVAPIIGMIFFIFFIHGLTSNVLLSNESIEFKRKLIEINVHDITKNVEILDHFVERHLLEIEKEESSKLMSIRRPEEHAKKKREYLEKRKIRLSEIQSRLKAIKKKRNKSTVDLKENGESLAINKNLIRKAERHLNDSIWLSIFSLWVMCLGILVAKVGFKRWNEVY